jgi:biopolymer transport protein TolQ
MCGYFLGMINTPFLSAWTDSDFIGRSIFIALIGLSLISWTILIHKWWITARVKQESLLFKRSFLEQKQHPLTVTYSRTTHPETPNAFYLIYEVIRGKTEELLAKNVRGKQESQAFVSASDIALVETHAASTIATVTRYLERNLYLLSTIVTLSPFLGLLGTVYGILVTFGGMSDATMGSNQQILGGLSLALTTTVIGLLNAIPALVGYNYLKNNVADFDHEMDRFATEVLSTLNMHYRAVEV